MVEGPAVAGPDFRDAPGRSPEHPEDGSYAACSFDLNGDVERRDPAAPMTFAVEGKSIAPRRFNQLGERFRVRPLDAGGYSQRRQRRDGKNASALRTVDRSSRLAAVDRHDASALARKVVHRATTFV